MSKVCWRQMRTGLQWRSRCTTRRNGALRRVRDPEQLNRQRTQHGAAAARGAQRKPVARSAGQRQACGDQAPARRRRGRAKSHALHGHRLDLLGRKQANSRGPGPAPDSGSSSSGSPDTSRAAGRQRLAASPGAGNLVKQTDDSAEVDSQVSGWPHLRFTAPGVGAVQPAPGMSRLMLKLG